MTPLGSGTDSSDTLFSGVARVSKKTVKAKPELAKLPESEEALLKPRR